jgi:hypothetical protein
MSSNRTTAQDLLDARLALARKLRVDALLDRYQEFTGLYATGPTVPAPPTASERPPAWSRS